MSLASFTGTQLAVDLKRQSRRATLRALGSSLLTLVLTLVAVLVLWQGAIWAFDLSPFVAKSPADVLEFMLTDEDASEVFENLLVTLGDAAVGFVAGLVVALLVASGFQLSKGFEHAAMPIALLLRSVPLIAFAPVIIMIFGRDFMTTAVMGGIVVLFPALVNIAYGLKSASPQMHDVVSVYGGSPATALRKVSLPSSLPAFFAAVRISAPGAITGALLAEWLATGRGVGGSIGGYISSAQFSLVWASVVVVTLVSLLLYNVVLTVENTVLARMGMHPEKRV
ncbi:ABC transporter permease [Demequina lignilytica]|uniref:ABC transporter permease subunit n=1 Tax=Demequina lignilytica TaxID=3051663 RepID=A0AAW7M5H3_9MICO|nr:MULTISPECIES: ABC transporter permease subunit [unclassified Demequina]MDN4478822.1 ABC transporter permease subunit [Demequina sp. SYSU T00039-1]MDN4484079.1 ABC transporter permease subunit [Demequina sp. SYSU T0a273]MDN4488920.1 ABC transporter permease subunit [Demequina sp. SYSU T00039]MDN4490338.1 ABC transporter permease subunit [Demequina sp. SYSU T00068]